MNKISGIYKIICLDNNRIYIGSSKDIKKRWNRHLNDLRKNKHDNQHLQRSFDKYGESSFVFEIIELCNNEELLIREQYYLDEFKPYLNGFNIGIMSSGGDNLTNNPNREEIINKIKKGLNRTISKMTDEEKKKRWSRPGKKNPNYGNRWSEEMKTTASYMNKGKRSPNKGKTYEEILGKEKAKEVKRKLSEIAKDKVGEKNPFWNKKHKKETKEIMSRKSKERGYVGNQNLPISIDGKIYSSLGEASKDLNIPITTIRWRVKSDNPKFEKWIYVDDIK
jgi:group I intron endonuclease